MAGLVNTLMSVQRVECGALGLEVSAIGLGCMGMSETYGPKEETHTLQALHASLEAEMNFWDTADIYGNGGNERLLSKVLATYRNQIVLASKCGITGRDAEGLVINGRPDYIHRACEASLKRLGVEYIDLYYLHRVDPDVPVEESVGALGELVDKGMVRFIGLSEAAADTVKRGHKEFPLSAVQSEYSLFSRGVEEEVLPLLRELKIALVAYSPLGRGFLTGEIRHESDLASNDFRRQLPRFTEENLQKNARLVERVKEVAKARHATPAQVALAWLCNKSGVIPIPGTTRPQRVFENAEAARLSLDATELEALNFSPQSVQGARYSPILAKSVER